MYTVIMKAGSTLMPFDHNAYVAPTRQPMHVNLLVNCAFLAQIDGES